MFTGLFENNLKTGLGRVTCAACFGVFFWVEKSNRKWPSSRYKKGGYFHGHFKDGQRNGEVEFQIPKIMAVENVPVKPRGQGTLQYANGDIYSGCILKGVICEMDTFPESPKVSNRHLYL